MKYVKEGLLKSGAIIIMVAVTPISMIYVAINTAILSWISEAVSSYNHGYGRWVNLIILGCVINTVIGGVEQLGYTISINKVFEYLSNKFVAKILDADYSLYSKYASSTLITIHGDLWKMANFIESVTTMVTSAINFVFVFIAILRIRFELVYVLVPLYIVCGVTFYFLGKIWKSYDDKMMGISHSINKEIGEIIDGYQDVRTYSTENKHRSSLKGAIHSRNHMSSMRSLTSYGFGLIANIIDSLVSIVILQYGVMLLQTGTIKESSIVMALVMYGWRLIGPMDTFIQGLSNTIVYLSPIKKFNEVMNYENNVPSGSIKLKAITNGFRFNDVGYCYNDSNDVLQNINLEINVGQKIGICGPTGSGKSKSTLARMLLKFYVPTAGNITVDGIDISNITAESLRSHIGMVHQDIWVFDDTIGNNIRYGCVRTVNDTELIAACKDAAIYDFVMSLPEGFDTMIGPRGLKLSGGQRQRIALARLFLRNPDIIIFDEATSSLDNETERIVQESMDKFVGKTMIVIAHRLSTIRSMDKIVVIDNHTIVEEGSHEQLMALDGIYATMSR